MNKSQEISDYIIINGYATYSISDSVLSDRICNPQIIRECANELVQNLLPYENVEFAYYASILEIYGGDRLKSENGSGIAAISNLRFICCCEISNSINITQKNISCSFDEFNFAIKHDYQTLGNLHSNLDGIFLDFINHKFHIMTKINQPAENQKPYIKMQLLLHKHKTEALSQPTVQAASSADEILKFKNLLDIGVITQEEFEEKKRQLLGL